MADSKHVKGLKELDALLKTLPAKMETNVLRGALRAGANAIKKEAAQNISSKSGALAKGLRVSARLDRRAGKVTASVKAGKKMGHIARFVEFGTRPHEIKPKSRSSLFFAGVFGEIVQHPGAKPHPFMRPALDSRASEAVVAAGNYIKKRLAKKHGIDTPDIIIEVDEP